MAFNFQDLGNALNNISNEVISRVANNSYDLGFGFSGQIRVGKQFEKLTTEAINSGIQNTKPIFRTELSKALDAIMESNLSWSGFEGRVTKRQSGETATFPRNIVDLGGLKASKEITVTPQGINVEYTADYAAAVHLSLIHI